MFCSLTSNSSTARETWEKELPELTTVQSDTYAMHVIYSNLQ